MLKTITKIITFLLTLGSIVLFAWSLGSRCHFGLSLIALGFIGMFGFFSYTDCKKYLKS